MFGLSKVAFGRAQICSCKLRDNQNPKFYSCHLHKFYEWTCKRFYSSTKSHVVAEGEIRPKSYGQPTSRTHPHLIRDGELRPFVTKSEFEERRQRLVDSVCTRSSGLKHIVSKHHFVPKVLSLNSMLQIVIPSASKQFMSGHIPYVFRQNSDFLYLTGCMEPDSCLILTVSDSPSNHNATLFMREKDSYSELWDGPRTGVKESLDFFGVKQALPVEDIEHFVRDYTKNTYKIWYAHGFRYMLCL